MPNTRDSSPTREPLKLYIVSNEEPHDWDVFTDIIVAAKSSRDARDMHPTAGWEHENLSGPVWVDWEHRDQLTVTLIGTALLGQKQAVLHATFLPG